MSGAYLSKLLPLSKEQIDQTVFFEELIDATSKFEVYKTKINDSKLESSWFIPILQQKEALASSILEGTQATLDEVLANQANPNDKDRNINEVANYSKAAQEGYEYLRRREFSNEFFYDMHSTLMQGNVRKPKVIGQYRTEQNYIGRNDKSHSITFIPPVPEDVPRLMNNLIDYINESQDDFRPLVRTAIIHAQFETIHPFMDGNGRVGRMLIPMYLFSLKQIDLPCFFISEALERDKFLYYNYLNDIRYKEDWNGWIKFFLKAVIKQCDKYIDIITKINELYERDLKVATDLIRASNIVEIINTLYRYPVVTAKQILDKTKISMTSINRYLGILIENKMLVSDNKSRNRTYYNHELLNVLRQ